MVTQELLDYIKAQMQQGVSPDSIKTTLLSHGWLQPDIDTALEGLQQAQNSPLGDQPPLNIQSQDQKGNFIKKLGIVTLIVIAFAAVTSGGVFAYFYFFPTPEMVFARMWNNFQTIHQFKYEGNVDVNMHMNAQPTPVISQDTLSQQIPAIPLAKDNHIKATFAGYTDISVLNRPQGNVAVTLSANLLGDGDSSISVEQLNVDPERMYFKFTKTENIPFVNLDSIKSDWIFYDTKSYAHELNSQKALSKDQTIELTKLAEKRKFFTITKTLPSEKINGSDTHHYAYEINVTELKAFITESSAIIKGSKLSDKELKDMNTGLNNEFKNIKDIGGEMWIGRSDYYPYKFTLSFVIEDKYGSSKFKGELSYKDFNKQVSLYPPSDSISTDTAMKKVLSAMYPDDNQNGVPDVYETQGGVAPTY